MHIEVDGTRTAVHGERFRAAFEGLLLTELAPLPAGPRYVGEQYYRSMAEAAVHFRFRDGGAIRQDSNLRQHGVQVSPTVAELVQTADTTEARLFLQLDESTGDLIIRPSGQTTRTGLAAIRWNLAALSSGCRIILPCMSGIDFTEGSHLIEEERFAWPHQWEAQLAIFSWPEGGFYIFGQDTRFRPKALTVEKRPEGMVFGFESENHAPFEGKRTAGGLEWRLNVFAGDWREPARRYRSWLAEVQRRDRVREGRSACLDAIRLAVSWFPPDGELLERLADVVTPRETLLHLADWRTRPLRVQYPDYTPSPAAAQVIRRAGELGFRVAPHFNLLGVDYQHPFYREVRDAQYRDSYTGELLGWQSLPGANGGRYAFINPAYSKWRHALIQRMLAAAKRLGVEAHLVSQTFRTPNVEPGLIENMTAAEGMLRFHEELAAIQPGHVVIGEGCNELSGLHQPFAQTHLFGPEGDGDMTPEHVEMAHPISAFLWQGHTRLLGYGRLHGGDADSRRRLAMYEQLNALPTLVLRTETDLTEPTEGIRRVLELAHAG